MTDDALDSYVERYTGELAAWFESADPELQDRIRTLGKTDRQGAVALMLEMSPDIQARAKADYRERVAPEIADELWEEWIRNGEIVPVLDDDGNHKLSPSGQPLFRNATA